MYIPRKFALILSSVLMLFCLSSFGQNIFHENFSGGSGNQLDSQWKTHHYRNPVVLKAIRAKSSNGYIAQITADKSGDTWDTFFRHISFNGNPGRIRISFKAKSNQVDAPLWVGLTSGTGVAQPALGDTVKVKTENKWETYEFFYDLTGMGENLTLEFLTRGTVKAGYKLLVDDIKIQKVLPEKLEVALKSPGSRVLFDGIPDQNAIVKLICRNGDAGYAIEVLDKSGENIFKKDYCVRGQTDAKIDFSKFALGEYKIIVTGPQQKIMGQWDIHKVPYKKQSVIIQNGVPYVNGDPFLMIGIFKASDDIVDLINRQNDKGIAKGKLTRREMMESLKERGFNSLHHHWIPSVQYVEEAGKHGLMVVSESKHLLERAMELRNYPNIFGWYIHDEPQPPAADECLKLYRKYKKADPWHPTMIAINNDGVGFDGKRFVDIVMPDPYTIFGPNGSVSRCATAVKNCRELMNGNDPTSSIFLVPQLFTAFGSGGFEPTYEQIRASVYGGISQGAKGVFYYTYYNFEPQEEGMSLNPKRKNWFLPESRLWNKIGDLNRELMDLKKVILFGKPVESIFLKSKSQVFVKAFEIEEGAKYLFVVNPEAVSQNKILIRGIPAKSKNMSPYIIRQF